MSFDILVKGGTLPDGDKGMVGDQADAAARQRCIEA